MIPKPAQTLSDLATRLTTHVLGDVTTVFGQADVALISGLMLTLAQDYERAVDNHMRDIAEMRALFNQCTDNAPGAARRTEFSAAESASWTLADVNALHAKGFELLIDLHAWAETADPDINTAIWALLRRHSERNKFEIPGP